MKILKIFGIVVGIHALALIMIFANPGCSSASAPPPAPAATAPKADPAPVVALPGIPAAGADAGAPVVAAPDSSSPAPETPVIAAGLFSPTRPGTLAAGALETQPVADVTPVTTTVVGRGDSLWSIAKRNHVKLSALAKANRLSADSPLHLGQKLIVPGAAPADSPAPARTARTAAAEPVAAGSAKYRVKSGETLGAIARKLRVKLSDLATANNISDPQKIHVGQELIVPGKGPSGGGAASPSSHAQDYGATSPPPPAPADAQDLDAGLKPAAPGDVPAIKLDDAAGQPRQQ